MNAKVDECRQKFDQMSSCIKKEIESFNVKRVSDFKESIVQCLEKMIVNQEDVSEPERQRNRDRQTDRDKERQRTSPTSSSGRVLIRRASWSRPC